MSRADSKLPEVVLDALWGILDHLYLAERDDFYRACPKERDDHLYSELLILYTWLHLTDGRRKGRV